MASGMIRFLGFSGILGLIALATDERSETSYTCLQCLAGGDIGVRIEVALNAAVDCGCFETPLSIAAEADVLERH
jgi:hypothetical protein